MGKQQYSGGHDRQHRPGLGRERRHHDDHRHFHLESQPQREHHPDRNTRTDSHSNGDTNSHSDTDRTTNEYTDEPPDRHTDDGADQHADADEHPDRYAGPDVYADTNRYADTDAGDLRGRSRHVEHDG